MNRAMPIYSKQDEILQSIRSNQVTIVTASTGSGKSTQIPQWLYHEGYDVYVTEPRRISAINTSIWVNEEMDQFETIVAGYQTGFETNRTYDTKILYCTDGLQLVRSITGFETEDTISVLCIDEVHEWNVNIETLVAWCHRKLKEGWGGKLILMSATFDATSLADYFRKVATVDVIELQDSLYPIEDIERDEDEFVWSIVDEVRHGREVMAFVPGKKEIEDTINEIKSKYLNAIIMPLHGELDLSEQRKCFTPTVLPRIVIATNVARTGVTPDIDTVVDMAIEKRIEVRDGIEGLCICQLSQADLWQNRGRTGRTKDGRYILCTDYSMERRSKYTTPEIQRLLLDRIVLQLMSIGIDPTELEFFHQPPDNAIVQAKNTLRMLEAIDENDNVTEDGKLMARLPMSTRTAKMILTSYQRGVLKDVIVIAAILEVGSLLYYDKDDWRNPKSLYSKEHKSDILAELDTWRAIEHNKEIDFIKMRINKKNYFRIRELIKKINDSLRHIDGIDINSDTTGTREDISMAYFVSMKDRVFVSPRASGEFYDTEKNNKFYIDNKSVVNSNQYFTIGIPRSIQFDGEWGKTTKHIIGFAEELAEEFVKQEIPEAFSIDNIDDYSYDPEDDCVVHTALHRFRDVTYKRNEIKQFDHPKYGELKVEWQDRKSHWLSSSAYTLPEPEYIDIDGSVYEVETGWSESKIRVSSFDNILSIRKQNCLRTKDGKEINIEFSQYPYFVTSSNPATIINTVVNKIIIEERDKYKKNLPTISSNKLEIVASELFPFVGTHDIGLNTVAAKLQVHNTEELMQLKIKPITVHIGLETNGKSVSLKSYGEPLKCRDKTQEALQALFDMEVARKCPERGFQFKIGNRWDMTPKCRKFYNDYRDFMLECRSNMNIDNIGDMIDMTAEYYNDSVTQLQAS